MLFLTIPQNKRYDRGGDRGHVVVNVPSPVVPYVPSLAQRKANGGGNALLSDGSIWQNRLQQKSKLSINRPRVKISKLHQTKQTKARQVDANKPNTDAK